MYSVCTCATAACVDLLYMYMIGCTSINAVFYRVVALSGDGKWTLSVAADVARSCQPHVRQVAAFQPHQGTVATEEKVGGSSRPEPEHA